MQDMVRKYVLMPKMMFPDEDIKDIAQYLYYTPLENKEWYSEHFNSEKQKYSKNTTKSNPPDFGRDLAMKTKAILGKNLLGAIQTKEIEGAVQFCSTRAITLTDSMAIQLNARIKRVCDKNRNPNNKVNHLEEEYIEELKKLSARGQKSQGIVFDKGNKHIGYYPIYVEQMCLQCHGSNQGDISSAVLRMIQKQYPQDKAINDSLNEVRGIWVVEYDQYQGNK